MAKKPSNKSTKAPQALLMSDADRIVEAGLAEAAALGWRNVSMSAVAARANLPLSAVLMAAPTRAHLVAKIFDRLDARMLEGAVAREDADSVRDRIFEIAMKRFDAMNANREGMRAVVAGARFDPAAVGVALCRADRSAAMMLSAAGVSPDGLFGYARIQGLKVVLACALKAWMDDDSADLAKTMAALDRALARAESLARFRAFRRPQTEAA